MNAAARFESLVEAHRHGVHGLAVAILQNAADAADVTQETFLQLWKHLPSIRESGCHAWLLRTARNRCLDRLRQRRAIVPLSPGAQAGEETFELPDPSPAPDRESDFRALQEEIRHHLEELPETWRTVFLLREVQDCPLAEIAEITGYPLNSVKVYLLRARRALQEQLQDLRPTSVA